MSAGVSVAQAVRDGADRLAGIADNPRLEARILLAHALGVVRGDLIREPGRLVDAACFDVLVERRVAREPLALIIGHREFWSLDFHVSPATLVPRPDSETLIEAALAVFAGRAPPRTILDLGTGTGCLLLALLTAFPSAFGIGVDLNQDAAALAKRNAVRLGLAGRAAFIAGDWTGALSGRFDLIVSNPPYIASAAIETLMPEVGRHEPKLALDGGADGYGAYRAMMPALPRHLEPCGAAILELGQGQAGHVADLAMELGLKSSLRLDLAEIPRAIVLTWLHC
ncbi:MAG TPA: peptide chain release factor N(5)-glutamine methyltransferase [Rhodopila sp.]|nr:peptide chain release factor N(5)-glutamine methyltransferase [Rhodopila sp.]